MKEILLLIISLWVMTSFGQTYELSHHDWDSVYPYEYTLTFEFPDEPNQVYFISDTIREERLTIQGRVRDYRDSALDVFIHRLDPSDSSVMDLLFTENGEFNFTFKSDTILLKFSLMDKVKTEYLLIESNGKERLAFALKLGRYQPFERYLINSKRKLTKDELEKTMNCLKENIFYHSTKAWDCSNSKDFYIGMTGG